jgi:hypothetical protein
MSSFSASSHIALFISDAGKRDEYEANESDFSPVIFRSSIRKLPSEKTIRPEC